MSKANRLAMPHQEPFDGCLEALDSWPSGASSRRIRYAVRNERFLSNGRRCEEKLLTLFSEFKTRPSSSLKTKADGLIAKQPGSLVALLER